MNMVNFRYEEEEPDYQNEVRGSAQSTGGSEKFARPQRRPAYKAKRTPTGFNGIHRRRNKRGSW